MSDYQHVGGSLKIKGVEKKSKKKKQIDTQKDSLERGVEKVREEAKSKEEAKAAEAEAKAADDAMYAGKTPAEIAFLRAQRERELERIRNKSAVSHKEKVQMYNTYLDKLSEHYDIPKVSWTK